MPNVIAYMMLLVWPLVTWHLFRRYRLETAVIAAFISAYLLLPPIAAFDLPLLPTMDKFAISTLAATAGVLAITGTPKALLPASPLMRALLLIYFASPLITASVNSDPLRIGPVFLPGLGLKDGISVALAQIIFVLPLLVGRMVLAGAEDPARMLRALVVAVAAYAPLMLAEIRLSPQMNTWIYGFFQHEFLQMMRGNGFRPIVFLPHALWLSLLTFFALTGAAMLARMSPPAERIRWIAATLCLAVLLVLCKSLASLLYGLICVPLVLMLPPRMLLRLAGLMAFATIAYPLLRGSGLVPVDWLLEQARAYDADRAQSLGFRFFNEDLLLARANERPLFGWGLWGRSFIYDPVTGRNMTITDGSWIITISSFGWFGYIALFGLLCTPLILLAATPAQAFARLARNEQLALAGLAILMAVNLADLLLNATLVPLTFLCIGVLLGSAERLAAPAAAADPALLQQGAAAQPPPVRTLLPAAPSPVAFRQAFRISKAPARSIL